MHRRQPLPRLWLMTDERMGENLWRALEAVPKGSGIVFRHYSLPRPERRRLFDRVRAIARRKRLVLLLAGSPKLAAAWGADGSHGSDPVRGRRRTIRSMPVHNPRELVASRRARANLLFVSPVFATRSHPGGRPLGSIGLADLTRQAHAPVVALGGVTHRSARALKRCDIYGWAAIDAWSTGASDQKRKAVPM
jgi:thiamine-phosphate pyrophosphorylase